MDSIARLQETAMDLVTIVFYYEMIGRFMIMRWAKSVSASVRHWIVAYVTRLIVVALSVLRGKLIITCLRW